MCENVREYGTVLEVEFVYGTHDLMMNFTIHGKNNGTRRQKTLLYCLRVLASGRVRAIARARLGCIIWCVRECVKM
jgi:hypothetical protein